MTTENNSNINKSSLNGVRKGDGDLHHVNGRRNEMENYGMKYIQPYHNTFYMLNVNKQC